MRYPKWAVEAVVVSWILILGINRAAGALISSARGLSGNENWEERDLLQVISVPFDSSTNGLDFEAGSDGFPAFGIRKGADIRVPYRLIMPEKLYPDFSLLLTVRHDIPDGSYVFAIVNPLDTVVQLGVYIGPGGPGRNNITLYYTDPGQLSSQVLAGFVVSAITKRWTRLAFAVSGDQVALYLNCRPQETITLPVPRPRPLDLDSASTLYIGQAGPLLKGEFVGAIQELKLNNVPHLAQVQCINTITPTFSNSEGSGQLDDEDLNFGDEFELFGSGDLGSGDGINNGQSPPLPPPPPPGNDGLPGACAGECPNFTDNVVEEIHIQHPGLQRAEKGDKGEPGPRGPPGEKGSSGVVDVIPATGDDMGNRSTAGQQQCGCNETTLQSQITALMPQPIPGLKGEIGDAGTPGSPGKTGNPGERGEIGMPGPKGERGDIGPTGREGMTGPKGEPGHDGKNGVPGIQGPPGPPGTTTGGTLLGFDEGSGMGFPLGRPGPPGSKGDQGSVGLPGVRGERGEAGPKGDRGDVASKGDKGERGRDGPMGLLGEKGEPGRPGADGAEGKPGRNGIPGIKGDTGPPGPPGLPWAMDDEDGSGSFKSGTSPGAKGDTGPRGIPGEVGPKGDKGDLGLVGPKGDSGLDGIPGTKGESGGKGDRGDVGPPGPVATIDASGTLKGDKGDAGKDGRRGKKGDGGPQGPPGVPGKDGEIGVSGWPGRQGRPGPPGLGTPGIKGDKGEPGEVVNAPGGWFGASPVKGDRGDPGPTGPPGPPGPATPSVGDRTPQYIPVPGPPGPPGPPGLPGLPAVPSSPPRPSIPVSSTNSGASEVRVVPGAVIFDNLDALLKVSDTSLLGTLAFLVEEESLVVRVKNGWQYVAMGSFVPVPTVPPVTTTSTTEPPTHVYESSHLINQVEGPSEEEQADEPLAELRAIALNEAVSGDGKGIRGLDYSCYKQARNAGLRGTFRAMISSRLQNMNSVVRTSDRHLPVVNAKGDLLFSSWNAIFDRSEGKFLYAPRLYSFDGKEVMTDNNWTQKHLWHGTDVQGEISSDAYCDSWSSNDSSLVGLASNLKHGRVLAQEKLACHNRFVVLCIDVTSQPIRRKRQTQIENLGTKVLFTEEEYQGFLRTIGD